MPSENEEDLIRGGWERVGDRMVPDASLLRIRDFITTELEKIADCAGGWETLFRNPVDGRFWERYYPLGEMHGGGPESRTDRDGDSSRQRNDR